MTARRREMFTTTLSVEMKDALKSYSDESMIPMSKLVEKALSEYLTKNNVN
ncbi:MAG: ribbon-helix-helix domain-containing protein [Fusobacteria bacterium]|nr:ribbon-helix-helix domain-containing protein [Fusobacteriota bacterium]